MSLNLQYKVGIKRQVVQSLRKVFESPNFPDKELANKINILLTYPIVLERYPAIYVSYTDKSIKDSGLGNAYFVANADGSQTWTRQWFFQGLINFNILALDPLERDILSAVLANMLAFRLDDPLYGLFKQYVTNEEFVSLQPNFSVFNGGSESERPAPWNNKNEFIYSANYSLDVLGSFYTQPGSDNYDLVTIDDIRSYPYRDDQPAPQIPTTQPIIVDWTT
jgi:hypothetical protein